MKTRHWTLFTNHAAIFFHLLEHPDATIRRIADELDLAERTVVGVLANLREDGYLLVQREGRHNVHQATAETRSVYNALGTWDISGRNA